jgi:hypothetical protein
LSERGNWRRREKLEGMRGRDLMKRAVGTGTGVLIVAACALTVGAAAGYAVNRDDATVVHACYRVHKDGSPAGGPLRVVSASASCRRSERPLVWNLRGPQGPAGDPGPPGPAGPPGPSAAADCNLENRIAKAVPTFQMSDACTPPPLCNDDSFEPNNTVAEAVPLDLGTTSSAVACAGDDDLFAVATGGQPLTATVTFDPATVLDVAFLDTSGTNVLASVTSGSSPLTVATPAGTTGTVIVRVRAVGNAQGTYTLFLS